jgi:hypothetical protein
VGIALVSFVSWSIVQFDPSEGIVARYPTFFLPIVAAFLYALVVSFHKPHSSVPIAYASGSVGALIGADILHVPDIRAHFAASAEKTIISIGGAGVFDMVFLAGTVSMALAMAVLVLLAGPRAPAAPKEGYPTRGVAIEDAARLYRDFQRLEAPNPLERALAGVALSDLALRDGDFGRSVRMSWLAVDSILKARELETYLGNGVHPKLRADVETLRRQYVDSRSLDPTLRQAGDANVAAKTLIAALAERAKLSSKLEVTG